MTDQTTLPLRWVLTPESLGEVFEAVPGKPYHRGGQVTGYRVFVGDKSSAVAMFGDVIELAGNVWRVVPAPPPGEPEPAAPSTGTVYMSKAVNDPAPAAPDMRIVVRHSDFPASHSAADVRDALAYEAELLHAALVTSLPQTTVDVLFALLAADRAAHLRRHSGAHTKTPAGTVPAGYSEGGIGRA